MKTPGFAAEASLYESVGHYQTGQVFHESYAPVSVLPQLTPQERGCIRRCSASWGECEDWCDILWEDPGPCRWRCIERAEACADECMGRV